MITMIYKPQFYRLGNDEERRVFEEFLKENNPERIDTIQSQLKELVLCQNPEIGKKDPIIDQLIQEKLSSVDGILESYGVWVYFPWKNLVIHILDEEEFVEVRTNRNKYKITKQEQDALANKKIGVAGLSVGRAAAVTIALERVAGEIRLADFDELELSNLNRIKAPISSIGVNKAVSTAREILELDPFLNVKCFVNGLNEENLEDFFTDGGRLDLFIEECDDIKIKILSRLKAKELRIPVIMETSDNCIIDIERFDLEPDRPIIHGQLEGLSIDQLNNLRTQEEKLPFITRFSGVDSLSPRMKGSMIEIERTIRTWPQLASDVTYGGGLITKLSSEILLNNFKDSGRYFGQIENILKPAEDLTASTSPVINNADEVSEVIKLIKASNRTVGTDFGLETVRDIVADSLRGTTAGNLQMFNWVYLNNNLYLVYDKVRGSSFLDLFEIGARISLGAIIEALEVSCNYRQIGIEVSHYPIKSIPDVVAEISLVKQEKLDEDAALNHKLLFERFTNRSRVYGGKIEENSLLNLKSSIENTGVRFQYIDNREDLNKISDIISEIDKLRIKHPQTHKDLFNELKFPTKDFMPQEGIDINDLDLSLSEKIGFLLSKDERVLELLNELELGSRLGELTEEFITTSSGVGILAIKKNTPLMYLEGGKIVQRFWMQCHKHDVSLHPFTALMFFHEHLRQGTIDSPFKEKLAKQINQFYTHFSLNEDEATLFMFRLIPIQDKIKREPTKRRNLDEVLYTA
jgi:molybdopterin/thiamine biosynthesis adenylyltransferase